MEDFGGQAVRGYELRRLLGEGGLGVVYLAYQQVVDREVAVKVILPKYANHPEFIRRFEVEAHLVARLEHPFIVPLYDYWREPDRAYLVMRYLRGGSLRDLLHDRGPLDLTTIAHMLDQIAAGLRAAHRHGVVHRDIKPANILLDLEGNSYLADFGIAKDLGEGSGQDQAEAMIGSPGYISPEQVKSESVTPQADLYSLGVVLYELLTGEHPFPGETPSTLPFKHLMEPLPSLKAANVELPSALDAIIQRATAKAPADRFPDALSLAAAFREAIDAAQAVTDAAYEVPTVVGLTTDPAQPDVPTTLLDAALLDVENPYKGLRAFQEADASDFYGRDALVSRLLDRLAETGDAFRFLAIVGPSGSGKSSVVRAGVIPALRQGRLAGADKWYFTEMLPGAYPLDELELALLRISQNASFDLGEQLRRDERGLLRATRLVLPDDDSEMFLLIDQFEELFTLVEDEAAREHFLNNLLAAVLDPRSRLRLLITLRADFYDRPLLYEELGEVMRRRTEVVLPMTTAELERAIAGPAERIGLTLEPGLTDVIIADVEQQPGVLPLLQYALTELFERREHLRLTRDAYRASGGALRALADSAEDIYTGLGEPQQKVARQIFLRLITPGEGADDTRRRVRRDELPFGPDADAVIDAFGRRRLLTFDRDPVTRNPTVEVAHEALIGTWQRLREWITDSREALHLHRRLAAAKWRNYGRPWLINIPMKPSMWLGTTRTPMRMMKWRRSFGPQQGSWCCCICQPTAPGSILSKCCGDSFGTKLPTGYPRIERGRPCGIQHRGRAKRAKRHWGRQTGQSPRITRQRTKLHRLHTKTGTAPAWLAVLEDCPCHYLQSSFGGYHGEKDSKIRSA